MRFYFPDTPDLPLPPGHRFPAAKYRMLRERVEREAVLGDAALVAAPAAERTDLLLAHDAAYLDAVLAGTLSQSALARIGLPWSPTLVARSLATVGGALAAARAAMEHGLSGQLAGGTHHAHRTFGSGYCVLNDLAVAALTLLAEQRVARVAILDLDVHQGDGTAAILGGVAGVLTVSVHGANNFPFRKVASDIDLALPDGTGDEGYLAALHPVLERVAAFRPDLVLYLSGADPLEVDRLGRLSLTHAGLMARDRAVLTLCRRHGFPVSIAIGGGYAEPIAASVEGYVNTFRAARETFAS
jgi:acetoin utilization deacetylase AcuC-like enzyme